MTRKEAIDKVYGMSGTKEQHEALEFLIPEVCELREFYERQSEDDRVRQALCDIVRDMPYMETELRAHGLTVEQAITYLEKQKEEEGYEAIPVESTLEYKLGFKAGKESEKQKYDWSEEARKILDSIIDDYEKAAKSFCGYAGKIWFLKAIRDGEYNLPNPAEWSEDESTRKWILEKVQAYANSGIPFPDEIQMANKAISYLEKQKEHQPNIELIQRSWYMEGYHDREFGKEPRWIIKTGEGGPKHELNPKYGQPLSEEQKQEWSEEDEKIYAFVYDFFENCWWNKTWDISREQALKMLKSLRPQPKQELGKEDEQNPAPIFKVGDRIKLKSEPEYPVREIVNIKDGAYYFDTDVYLPFKEQGRWEAEQKPAAMINGEPISTENKSVDIPLSKWNEEDEKTINMAIETLEHENYLVLAKKLKSLRPYWISIGVNENVAERFARIVRANLPEIGKDAQSQFEQLYLEITGNKMYGGYND